MKQRFDMSVGQRLGVGFGLLLLVLFGLVAAVGYWHTRSADAEHALRERILPLAQQADNLQRDVLYVAISLRAYLRIPNSERLQHYRDSLLQARASLRTLAEQPKTDEAEVIFRNLELAVVRYFDSSNRLIEQRDTQPIGAADEELLAQVRAESLELLNTFRNFQTARLQAGIADMATSRRKVGHTLQIASIVTALLFAIVIYFTTQSIRRPAKRLLEVASALEAGDWRPALKWAPGPEGRGLPRVARNEMMKLGRSFGAAAAALEQREQRLRADGQVTMAAAESLDRTRIAETALARIVDYLRVEVGVVYWFDTDTERLVPIAKHALSASIDSLSIGEGFPGQAAKERRILTMHDIPTDSAFAVTLGYDRAPPKAVVAAPIVLRDQLQGIVVLASLRPFDETALDFLRYAVVPLGIGLQNARAHADLRDKSEQIQAQNEELQAQNEEIQAQSEEIQAQSEEIQAQHEEIQTQNEELKQYAEELRAHASDLLEASERKSEFLGVLAHELRNPLAAITNGLQVLERTSPDSEPARRAKAVMDRQVQQLIRLIDDLLDITRISQGKLEIQQQPVNLTDAVRACIEDQNSLVKDNELTLQVPSAPVLVKGDYARLCQVIGNLLHNAVKFTDENRKITVTLRTEAAMREAVLRVADNGIGIDATMLPQLFRAFNQGSVESGRLNTGLGLGLALVKELVELHGGMVEARSAGRDHGAEFIVRLPLIDTVRNVPIETDVDVPRHTEGRRILVLEDNTDVAESLRDLLEVEGHHVEIVHSGAKAIERMRRSPPDVLLCDIGLPGIDGYQVVEKIRADERLRGVCLVALTGYASPGDVKRASDAGFDYHLPKPLSIERLREIIATVTNPASSAL